MSQMAENNIGSLVVLKPGDEHPAGIITERGKIILYLSTGT
jgi:CBS domain-containing protein